MEYTVMLPKSISNRASSWLVRNPRSRVLRLPPASLMHNAARCRESGATQENRM